MSLETSLKERSNATCELCSSAEHLQVYEVPPVVTGDIDKSILTCSTCKSQIENPDQTNPNHWRCLNDSMWTTIPAVQVVAWRMLNRLKDEGWPMDLLDMLYLDEETMVWAKDDGSENTVKVVDSNGAELKAGDTVVLIKDLNVKGAGFTAKRGTAVRNIGLVHDDPEHIQGKVEGQQIYILTKYLKKN